MKPGSLNIALILCHSCVPQKWAATQNDISIRNNGLTRC